MESLKRVPLNMVPAVLLAMTGLEEAKKSRPAVSIGGQWQVDKAEQKRARRREKALRDAARMSRAS